MEWKVVTGVTDFQELRKEGGGKSRRTIQIFFKVDGSKTCPLETSPSAKVGDIMSRIPSGHDTKQDM